MDRKIDIATLKEILREFVEDKTQIEILKEIDQALNKQSETDAPLPKEKVLKKGIVIITSLPQGVTQDDLHDITGFFTEIPLEDPLCSVAQKLEDIKASYRSSKKAKKNPVQTLGELLELAPQKMLKEYGILKKPQESIQIIHLSNKL